MRCLATALLLLTGMPAGAEELILNFRGHRYKEQLFRYDGQTPQRFIHADDQGLRWQFPFGYAPPRPVGIYWRAPVQGDFVTTAHYEILQADRIDRKLLELSTGLVGWLGTPFGAAPLHAALYLLPRHIAMPRLSPGPELYLMLDNPSKDGISFGRLTSLTFLYLTTDETGNRRAKETRFFPITAASQRGRLRLARRGATLTASLAEGDQEPFREVHRTDIGTADVRMVRFAGSSGGDSDARLDLRLLEFRLQGDSVQQQQKVHLAQSAPTSSPSSGGRRWLAWTAGATVLLVALATLLVFWRRRRANAHAAAVPASEHDPPPESARSSSIAFACTCCGKPLRARCTAAGKMARCPGLASSAVEPGLVAAALAPRKTAEPPAATCTTSHPLGWFRAEHLAVRASPSGTRSIRAGVGRVGGEVDGG